MAIVTGRFREARLYLIFAVSSFYPGVQVPTFRKPRQFKWPLSGDLTQDDLTLIVDEGRRQLDRQLADLEHIRNRAGALLTVCLAELAALSAGASRIFAHALPTIAWAFSVVLVVLSVAGAVALLSSQATFGRVDTMGLAVSTSSVRRVAARAYARSVGQGEETIATRVTVFRDAVFLAVLGAILYAVAWPIATLGAPADSTPPGPVVSGTPPTCVPASQTATSGAPSCSTYMPSSPSPQITQPSPTRTSPNPQQSSPHP
jgi:hypothetical protein